MLDDPLKVVSRLEPPALNSLAEDGYQRNRHNDLTMMAAEGPSPATDGSHRARAAQRWLLAKPRRSLAAVGLTVAAAAAITVAALPAGHPAPVGGHQPTASPSAATASGFLLTSAEVAARSPEAAGTYWYVKERHYGTPAAKVGKSVGKSKKGSYQDFGAMYASTEESWTGQRRARTIVNEDTVFTFASKADKARWESAGRPPLVSADAPGATGPVTSDYTMTFHWGVGSSQLTLAGVRKLPTTAAKLHQVFLRMWNREPDKAGAVGLANPTFSQYLVAWAAQLLDGPARPGTKAALYRLLAEQPGINLVRGLTDPMGRTGVGIGDGAGDSLVIDPGSARLIDYVAHPVQPDSTIQGVGVSEYIASGWTNQLGVAP